MDKYESYRNHLPLIEIVVLLIFVQMFDPTTSLSLMPDPGYHKTPEIYLHSFTEEDSFEIISVVKEFKIKQKFQNDFISKRGNDYIISAEAKSVVFSCEAANPITWKFPFPEQLKSPMDQDMKFEDHRISDFGQQYSDPVSIRYRIVLTIKFTFVDFFSVNVTCSSVESNPEVKSSIHIYLDGKSVWENEGKTVQITAEPVSQNQMLVRTHNLAPVILPCRPSSPDVKPYLEKQDYFYPFIGSHNLKQNKTWLPVHFSGNADSPIKFDPKFGFLLYPNILGNHIFGVYRCSVVYTGDDDTQVVDSDQFVIVNVTKRTISTNSSSNPDKQSISFEPKIIFHGTASVNIEPDGDLDSLISRPEIECCSGIQNKHPTMYITYCYNPLKCEMTKRILAEQVDLDERLNEKVDDKHDAVVTSNGCIKSFLAYPSSVVICKGKNVDYAQALVHVFRPELSGPVENRTERVKTADIGKKMRDKKSELMTTQMTSMSEYVAESGKDSVELANKMVILVAKSFLLTDADILEHLSAYPMIFPRAYDQILEAAGEQGVESLIKMKGIDSVEEVRRVKTTYLKECDRDIYYVGEPLTFMCFGVKFFYSHGPHIRLNWKNGTKTILEKRSLLSLRDTTYLYMSGNAIMFESYGDDLVPMFGSETVASREMSSVDCWMPARSESKWDKISKSIKVLPSVAPRFQEKEEEIVYFYLGDIGKVTSCTVVEGTPFPTFKVTRDGKLWPVEYSEPENDTLSTPLNSYSFTKGGKEADINKDGKFLLQLKINFNTVNITHRHHNVWQCIAENVNGTVIRTIRIMVIEKPGIILPISLSTSGVLCLIALGLGVKHFYDKRVLKSLGTNSNL